MNQIDQCFRERRPLMKNSVIKRLTTIVSCSVLVCVAGCPDADLRVLDMQDNCPDHFNPDQTDADGDGIGDAGELVGPISTPAGSVAFEAFGGGTGDLCDPFPMYANCGPMGMLSYMSLVGAYGSGLALRRRRAGLWRPGYLETRCGHFEKDAK